MRRVAAAMALGAVLIGSACSDGDSQSVNADGSGAAALNAEIVDDQVGSENGAPSMGDEQATEALGAEELEAAPRSTDGQSSNSGDDSTTTGSTTADGNSTQNGSTNGAAGGGTTGGSPVSPSSTIPVLGVPAAPEGGVIIDSGVVDFDAATTTEMECFVDDFGQRASVDLLNGVSGGVDLSNPELTDAIALQAGFHPGPTLLAADSCLSPEARFEVAANTPLLQNFGIDQRQLDCMWPALQLIGEELSSGVTLEELYTAPREAMIPPIQDVVNCLS